jgi:4-hydroxybenzoyl-CoA thioesterase
VSYRRDIRVEFNHCDPAGIVFFPRYYEMLNSVIENFFRDVLEAPWERVTTEEGHGVPTVRLETEFRAPSRLGEVLAFSLRVVRLGRSSVDFALEAVCGDELRLASSHRLVWVGRDGRAAAWPEALRGRLAGMVAG